MYKTLRKQILALTCILALSLSFSAAFGKTIMNHHDYVIEGVKNGDNVYLNEQKKEYDNVKVSYYPVKLGLWWHNWPYADKWYPDNQTLSVGEKRRVWWNGGPAGDYHIYQECISGNYYVESSGDFQNYV
mgnify:CR=1 FL=1